MARARAAEHGVGAVGNGGAARVAPPADPLRIVQAAVAGDDLLDVIRQVADGCGHAVAVSLPAHGSPVHWPSAGADTELLSALSEYTGALIAGRLASVPDGIAEAIPVLLGPDTVGVVAALGPGPAEVDLRAWLQAAAAAVGVTTLMRESGLLDADDARRSFLEALELNPGADLAGVLAHARRLGLELNHGAVGLCALGTCSALDLGGLPEGAFLAEVGAGRLLGLVPLVDDGSEALAADVLATLREAGFIAAASLPRRSPDQLQTALLEAAVLAELLAVGGGLDDRGAPQEETYRLLIGVLLRSPDELARLRGRTVAELERYDALHDTELLATLQAFLAHDGSTTETAEAMSLHRHTVGYRLARVQEVAGLSPYDSDGRERLSLGLKADRILTADARRLARARPAA